MLCDTPSVRELRLACCTQLTDAGGRALAEGLESNSSLTSLDLSWWAPFEKPNSDPDTRAASPAADGY